MGRERENVCAFDCANPLFFVAVGIVHDLDNTIRQTSDYWAELNARLACVLGAAAYEPRAMDERTRAHHACARVDSSTGHATGSPAAQVRKSALLEPSLRELRAGKMRHGVDSCVGIGGPAEGQLSSARASVRKSCSLK